MWNTVIYDKCGAVLKYDDRSAWLGNREKEEVECPVCGNVVASVFADSIPNVVLIKNGNTEVHDASCRGTERPK